MANAAAAAFSSASLFDSSSDRLAAKRIDIVPRKHKRFSPVFFNRF